MRRGFYAMCMWYGATRFAWEFLKPYPLLVGPFNIFHSAFVHANLNWTFGPLRYVISSPVFHRWHHSRERDGATVWMRNLIVEMQLSALVVTHDQSEAMAMSDRILLLNGGVIAYMFDGALGCARGAHRIAHHLGHGTRTSVPGGCAVSL